MVNALRLLLLVTFGISTALGAQAASPWESIAAGQNREQVARALGVPVLRNAGRGHETWVYDAGASVQFHGGLVSAWTAPKRKAPATTPAERAPEPAQVAQKPAGRVNPPRLPPASPRLS